MGGDGFTFTSHNLQSGETKELFTIQNKAGYGAISPDGQWIVFADRIFGANNWGIFISRLDGSERKLVAEPEVPTAFASVWGPDGQWLIVNTSNQDGVQIPVLINPFTCQVARLNNFNGMVEGWSP
jgi:Tol biopolymer transport system component